jgi:hypothetical protein
MPAIFFHALTPAGESGTGSERRSEAEQGEVPGYSGRLSFEGGFDRFGFVGSRSYVSATELRPAGVGSRPE